MKKFLVFALMIAVGVSMAVGSTLKVPWYVDNADVGAGAPPANGVLGLVTLTSNSTDEDPLICSIEYFNNLGDPVGYVPAAGAGPDNTFAIAPRSSLSFRPVADEAPGSAGALQEGGQGQLVPNRGTDEDNPKKNGSIVISWPGDPSLIQGAVSYVKGTNIGGSPVVVSYQHLLPAGVGG